MFEQDDISNLQTVFQSASSALILLKTNPTFDQLAAALSLLLALHFQKKEAYVVCADPMRVEFGNLVGVDQVQQTIGNRSLQISFDYDEKTVENVSYNIDHENKKFHLVVRPQKGYRSLDPQSVEYSHTGLDADIIFMIGVNDYSDIQPFYEQEEQSFHQAHVVALHKVKTTFAEINLDGSDVASFSEMMYTLLKELSLELTSDVATNLLAGIEQATDSFRHYAVTADTFEAVATLMRQGARRIRPGGTQQPSIATTNLAQAFSSQTQATQPSHNTSVSVTPSSDNASGIPQLQRTQVPQTFSPDKR